MVALLALDSITGYVILLVVNFLILPKKVCGQIPHWGDSDEKHIKEFLGFWGKISFLRWPNFGLCLANS
jgi:hypothetical protein